MKAFKTGYKTDTGKDELILCPSTSGDLLNVKMAKKPISANAPLVNINGQTYIKDPIPIPCGTCIDCRMKQARVWKNRAVLESIYAHITYFVTLTYDDEHLPFDSLGVAVLDKSDVQKFFKRLRRAGFSFRYLLTAEYGSATCRPHYHALLFMRNGPLPDLSLTGVNTFYSPSLERLWSLGHVLVQEATPGSIAYTAGYVEKKAKQLNLDEHSVPPFRLASRKPGLGYEYYRDHCKTMLDNALVYGDFGSSMHETLPPYFLYLLEKDDLELKEFKDSRRVVGKRFSNIEDSIFGTPNKEAIGFMKQGLLMDKIKKVRIEKYDVD